MKIKYRINGKDVSKKEFRKRKPKPLGAPMVSHTYRAHDPLLSDGIGCMKSQVKEMRQEIRNRNIQGVLVRDNGQLEITSRRGRREVMRMRCLADADAGWGD